MVYRFDLESLLLTIQIEPFYSSRINWNWIGNPHATGNKAETEATRQCCSGRISRTPIGACASMH